MMGIELGIDNNIENTKRVFNNKIRKYFDRIKLNMCKDQSVSEIVAKACLFGDYQTLFQSTEIADPMQQTAKPDEIEEKKDGKDKLESQGNNKRGRKAKNKIKKVKITDKFWIGGEEELNIALEEFFTFLYENKSMNLYEFWLLLVEFVLKNKNHCQYLIYSPSSMSFLYIFQNAYITIDDWVNTIPLESWLFLAEIILKSPNNITGYQFVADDVISKIANYNINKVVKPNKINHGKLLLNHIVYIVDDEHKQGGIDFFDDRLSIRVLNILAYFYSEIDENKRMALKMVKKAFNLLWDKQDTNTDENDQESFSIILPWISFEQWITKEKLESFLKEVQMEVDIKYWKKISENAPKLDEEESEPEPEFDNIDLDAEGESGLSQEEIERLKAEREQRRLAKKAKRRLIKRQKVERNFTVGLFFLNKAFEIAEVESNQQKDKEKIKDCLKNCEDWFDGIYFKEYFMLYRFMLIKLDLLRLKGPKISSTLYPTILEQGIIYSNLKLLNKQLKPMYNISMAYFEDYSIKIDLVGYLTCKEHALHIAKELNEGVFGNDSEFLQNFIQELNIKGVKAKRNKGKASSSEHHIEALICFKQMMTLLINFINPHNIVYLQKANGNDSFHAVFGLMLKLQVIICWLSAWAVAWSGKQNSESPKENSYEFYSELVEMLLMIDFAGNQSEGILKLSYHKFLKLFFRDILSIWTFMKWNKINVESVDSLLNRVVYQTYGIDFSYESNDENREQIKSSKERNNKNKSFS